VLFEANALVYAAIASWHDVTERRVPNALNALYFFPTAAVGIMDAADVAEYAAFILASLAFAYALFYLRVWGGGDAKCFIALSAGMPLLASGAEVMMLPVSFVAAAFFLSGWRLLNRQALKGSAGFVPFLCVGTLATAALFKSGMV